jgi:hypothetical protein
MYNVELMDLDQTIQVKSVNPKQTVAEVLNDKTFDKVFVAGNVYKDFSMTNLCSVQVE